LHTASRCKIKMTLVY